MNKPEIIRTIQKKLVGRRLNYKEIYALMDEISHHRLSDVLTTYFVAASFKEGFSSDELYYITRAMVETGQKLNFKGIVADKHSTGGLPGARTTMIVVPIVAAAGFQIPKTSSKAITSPAGTADVMEVLAKVTFTPREIEKIVSKTGGCIVWGGHLGIAPADDTIIRIEEPLSFESFDKIIVSIMAKKVAACSNHLILDIPVGRSMKIRHEKDAQTVAKKFKELASRFGIKVIADVCHTTQPPGDGIGPFLEAVDVLKVLEQKPDRPLALEKRAIRLAGKLLDLCYETKKEKANGEEIALNILKEKKALTKFLEIVKAQGGSDQISSLTLKINTHKTKVDSSSAGKILQINNRNLNTVARILGAPGHKNAGIFLEKKVGDKIQKNEPILTFYSPSSYHLKEAMVTLKNFPIYIVE